MSQQKTITQLKAVFESGDFPTGIDFENIITKAATFSGDTIFTSLGRFYDIVGFNDTQRGAALVLALSEITNGEYIFLPPGEYFNSLGFHWKYRDGGIIGLAGSSKGTHLYSDANHTLIMDTFYLLYNSIMKNFAVSQTSTGLNFDAVFWGGVDGAGQDQSQVEMDIHIAQADRDGLHIEKGIISGRFILKTAGQVVATGIDRYMIYAEDSSGFNCVVDNNAKSKFFLESTTSNISIFLRTTIQSGNTLNAEITDLGTKNAFFSPSDVKAFRRNIELPGARVVSPALNVPSSFVGASYPFDRSTGAISPDLSQSQNDGIISGGVTLETSSFGNMTKLDGINGMITIPTSTALQDIDDKIIISFLFSTNQDTYSARLMFGAGFDVKYDFSATRLEVGINIGGTNKTRNVTGIEKDTLYLITYCYDGTRYFVRKNTVEQTSANLASSTINIGGSPLVIGNISSTFWNGTISGLIITNDFSDELLEAVESQILLNSNTETQTPLDRLNDNKVYADIGFESNAIGTIYIDRTTGQKRRQFLDNGVWGDEAI